MLIDEHPEILATKIKVGTAGPGYCRRLMRIAEQNIRKVTVEPAVVEFTSEE